MAKVKPQLKVRSGLMKKGHTISSWAKVNGYDSAIVRVTVQRWAGKVGVPRGEQTRQILSRLEVTLGKSIYTKID